MIDRPINMGDYNKMKTTMEIPDSLFRRAKARAASRGQTMASFINGAIEAQLRHEERLAEEKPWMAHAGAFAADKGTLEGIERRIEEDCGRVDPEEWV